MQLLHPTASETWSHPHGRVWRSTSDMDVNLSVRTYSGVTLDAKQISHTVLYITGKGPPMAEEMRTLTKIIH